VTSNAIVQKLWNYCNILRDDGLSYGDYLEQLTFLLFLKMADERRTMFPNQPALIPKALDWQSLERLDGDDLDVHYKHILTELGRKPGLLGPIFRKAQNKIQDPAKLKRLVSDLIGREQWTTLGVDVKGDAYEGLLEKNAADVMIMRCRRVDVVAIAVKILECSLAEFVIGRANSFLKEGFVQQIERAIHRLAERVRGYVAAIEVNCPLQGNAPPPKYLGSFFAF